LVIAMIAGITPTVLAPSAGAASAPMSPFGSGTWASATLAADPRVACDIDGDSTPNGIPTQVRSSGTDDLAAHLRALPSGVDLGPADPAYEWLLVLCETPWVDPATGEPGTLEFLDAPPTQVVTQAAAAADARLVTKATSWAESLAGPVPATSPSLELPQTVGLPVWLSVRDTEFIARQDSWTEAGVTVTAVAIPVGTEWLIDGVTTACTGPGTPRPAGAPITEIPTCGTVFQRNGPVDIEVRNRYQLELTSTLSGEAGPTEVTSLPTPWTSTVGEVQAWSIESGQVDLTPPSAPDGGPSPADVADRATADAFCEQFGDAVGAAARWSPVGLLARAGDGAAGLVGADIDLDGWVTSTASDLASGGCELAGELGVVADLLWNALRGCISNITDLIQRAKHLISEAARFAQDPVAFTTQVVDTGRELIGAATEDTATFLADFVGSTIREQLDLDALENEGGAFWVGKVGCRVAMWVANGGPQQLVEVAQKAKAWVDRLRNGLPLGGLGLGRSGGGIPDAPTAGSGGAPSAGSGGAPSVPDAPSAGAPRPSAREQINEFARDQVPTPKEAATAFLDAGAVPTTSPDPESP